MGVLGLLGHSDETGMIHGMVWYSDNFRYNLLVVESTGQRGRSNQPQYFHKTILHTKSPVYKSGQLGKAELRGLRVGEEQHTELVQPDLDGDRDAALQPNPAAPAAGLYWILV